MSVAENSERILVVEDAPSQAEVARLFLTGLGYDARIAATAAQALAMVAEWTPDGMLVDVGLPDRSGIELLPLIAETGHDPVVVIVTANGSLELAKQAIRAGAEDFLVKPYNRDRLSMTLKNALEKRALAHSRQSLEAELVRAQAQLEKAEGKSGRKGFLSFVGASDKMRAVYEILQSVAPSKASVFITGESGTGKELAAEALHKASPRAAKAFVALNCGAIPRDLLESEVFGHVKGAFTGATSDRIGAAKRADGGTLFLDEIGEMPLDMQVKLLRFIQTHAFSPVGGTKLERVDTRFVCATNRDPLAEVEAKRFREDLYYRLYVVPVELPPLRERDEDVLLIARHFLTQFSKEEGRRFRGFSPEAEAMLMGYSWPGNVRQLQNVVRNIVVLHDGLLVMPSMLPPPVNRPASRPVARAVVPLSAPAPVEDVPDVAPLEAAVPEAPLPEAPLPVAPLPVASLPVASLPVASLPVASLPVASLPVASRNMAPAPEPRMPEYRPAAAAAPQPEPARPSAAPEIEVMPLAEMERRMVIAALARSGNDIPRAAAMLEVNPSTIYRKVSQWRKEGLLSS